MDKKNIVSIEDRIPNLKQARKKKANRRLIFYLGLFAILISLVVYLQSPLSHVQQVEVSGNSVLKKETIQEWSAVTSSDNFWSVNTGEVQERISNHPEIDEATVSKKFFSSIEINVKEFERVGYFAESGNYYPVLGNGILLKESKQKAASGDAPILLGFKNNEYLKNMAAELRKLPKNISVLISEISWQPTKDNPYKIHLFMTDGYKVEGTIRDFSTNMEAYPSIVAQLDPSVEGVIHIGVGAYFEAAASGLEESDDLAAEEVQEDEAAE